MSVIPPLEERRIRTCTYCIACRYDYPERCDLDREEYSKREGYFTKSDLISYDSSNRAAKAIPCNYNLTAEEFIIVMDKKMIP